MAHVEYPQAIIDEARRMGVQLGSGEEYDPSDALETLGQEMQVSASMHGDVSGLRFAGEELVDIGEDDFGGFSFKKLARGIGRAAKGAVKGVGKVVRSKPFQYAMPGVAAMVGKGPMVELGKKFAPGPLKGALNIGAKVNSAAFDAVTGGKKPSLKPK